MLLAFFTFATVKGLTQHTQSINQGQQQSPSFRESIFDVWRIAAKVFAIE